MTRAELLQLVVGQARSQGFPFKRWFAATLGREWMSMDEAIEVLASERRYYALLFSHDFAKSFWKAGSEMMLQIPTQTFQRRMANGSIGTVERKGHMRRMVREDAWRFHVKEMAAQEEPLRYIRRFLRVKDELVLPPPPPAEPPIVIVDEEDLLPEDED